MGMFDHGMNGGEKNKFHKGVRFLNIPESSTGRRAEKLNENVLGKTRIINGHY